MSSVTSVAPSQYNATAEWDMANVGPITMSQFKVSKMRITACIMAHILDSRYRSLSFSVLHLSRGSLSAFSHEGGCIPRYRRWLPLIFAFTCLCGGTFI